MEVDGQLYSPADLPPGRVPRCLLNRRLGGPQSSFERFECLLPLTGDKNRTVTNP